MVTKLIAKYGAMACAFALVAARFVSLFECAGPFYQPKEPEDFNL